MQDRCLTNARWIPDKCQMYARLVLDLCWMDVMPVPDRCQACARQMPNRCLMSDLQVPNCRQTGAIQMLDECLTGCLYTYLHDMQYSPNQINCMVLISIISPLLISKNHKPLKKIEAFEKTNQSRPNRAKSVMAFRSTKLARAPPQNWQ